tara:strand:- start:3526 stop:4041 length:516 start_codon:yes stop_codon:yes gene_type:complete
MMKITRTLLRRIIREEIAAVTGRNNIKEIRGTTGPEVAAAQDSLDDIYSGPADEERDDLSYTAIEYSGPILQGDPEMFKANLQRWTWMWNGLDIRAAEKRLHDADVDPVEILDKVRKDIVELWKTQGQELEDSGYEPSDAWVRLAAEALGMKDKNGKLPWSERPDFNPHRQ